jgi:hypothetical protein
MAEEIGIQCLRFIEFKFRPSFCNFQEKQGSKFAVCSEEDKMLPMDLSPRGNDGVEDLFRSFEPNQVQLVRHRMTGPLVSARQPHPDATPMIFLVDVAFAALTYFVLAICPRPGCGLRGTVFWTLTLACQAG